MVPIGFSSFSHYNRLISSTDKKPEETTELEEVAEEMQRILKDVDPDVIVDAGGHSLGTTLLLQAYETPGIKDRIRQT